MESISGIVQRAPARDVPFIYTTGDRPLDGYTIKRGIGRGGFGEVYYATSDGGKEVALKLVQRHLDVELRGVTQCLNLKHPHLVTLYDVRQAQNGDTWVVMEYVSGENLADILAANPNGMSPDQVSAWLRSICSGVAHLHEHGIVHRDLKPGNIFVEHGVVKIGDYGLAKYISASRRSGQTESVGTVHYMAPEISRGRYGKEIDLYALGVILYEMLTGHVPFNGESPGEILMRHLTEEPDVSALPDPYRAVVARLLAKDPAARYATVTDMLGELNGGSPPASGEAAVVVASPRARFAQTASWRPSSVSGRTPRGHATPRRSSWLLAVLLATAVGLAIGLIWLLRNVRSVRGDVVSEMPATTTIHVWPVVAGSVGASIILGTLAILVWLWSIVRKSSRRLLRAARRGDTAAVRKLLDAGANIDARGFGGRTPLLAAASAGNSAVVRLLLEHGADANARTNGGETALSVAVVAGHVAITETLLEAGADVNSRASDGDSPLIEAAYAGHVAILRTLLRHGADMTARTSGDGSTAIIWAAYEGHSACVEALLEHGADPNEKDTGDGSTALIWAAYGNHPNVVKVLLDHGADPHETNSSGETALDHAGSDTITQMLSAAIAQR